MDTQPEEEERYEILYRAPGALEWSTTGEVSSPIAAHTFPAGTFQPGDTIEFRLLTKSQSDRGGLAMPEDYEDSSVLVTHKSCPRWTGYYSRRDRRHKGRCIYKTSEEARAWYNHECSWRPEDCVPAEKQGGGDAA